MGLDELHPMTVRVSRVTFLALKAMEAMDGIAPATRLAEIAEERADKFRHASNVLARSLEREQAAETLRNTGD